MKLSKKLSNLKSLTTPKIDDRKSLKVGDKVRFLNDVGGGIISKIEGNMVIVTSPENFDIPVNVNEVVVIEKSQIEVLDEDQLQPPFIEENFDEQKEYETILKPVLSAKEDGKSNRLNFSIVIGKNPNSINGYFDIYILSECDFQAFYTVGFLNNKHQVDLLAHGDIGSQKSKHVISLPDVKFRSEKKIYCTVLPFKNITYTPQSLHHVTLNCHPVDFFKPQSFINHAAFSFPVMVLPIVTTSENPLKDWITQSQNQEIEKTKKEVQQAIPKVKKNISEIEEYDLHIEELVDYPEKLEQFEKLNIQIRKFTQILEQAILERTHKKIVFIHGVGSGKLKSEIRNYIDTHYPNIFYDDAPYQQYGLGATIVHIK